MKYRFTQLPHKLPYPPSIRASLSTIHSDIVTYMVENCDGTFNQKRKIIDCMNYISYNLINNNTEFELRWNREDPLSLEIDVDIDEIKRNIGDLYIVDRDVNWDVSIVDKDGEDKIEKIPPLSPLSPTPEHKTNYVLDETPKSDLFIQSPEVPRFDYNKVWASGIVDECVYCIYTSLPEIPKKQNDISVTTDVSKMTDSDLLNLYPNNLIKTRPAIFYDRLNDMFYDEDVGSVMSILGVSSSQLIDNVIRYPHLFRLYKVVDGDIVSFYKTIEIDGELHNVSDVWKDIKDVANFPYNKDYVKEYVVRRYLVERDILGVDHKYKMYGELDPFLTLFMTARSYEARGYDKIDTARKCVESRVNYKKSRNPVLKRLQANV